MIDLEAGEMRLVLHASIAVVALTFAAEARAQESVDHERAVAAFEEARALVAVNDCEAALPKLEESLHYEPLIGAHFKAAECLEEKEPYAAFWHLREAASLAHDKRDERGAIAERRADEIALRAGGVRVQLGPEALALPGLDVRLDGKSIDRFHVAGPIATRPGKHFVSATSADGRRFERTVLVDRGIVTVCDVTLAQAPPPAPAAPLPRADAAPSSNALSGRQTLALVLAGAGAASLAVGTAYGIVTLEKRGELDRACNGSADACTGAPSVVDPVVESAERNATTSTVLIAAGAGLVAAAAFFWFTAPSRAAAASGRPMLVGLRW